MSKKGIVIDPVFLFPLHALFPYLSIPLNWAVSSSKDISNLIFISDVYRYGLCFCFFVLLQINKWSKVKRKPFSPILPVQLTLMQIEGQQGHITNIRLMPASLQQQHLPTLYLRQSIRHHGARRPPAHDHKVVLLPQELLVERPVLWVQEVVVVIRHGGQH